MIPETFSVDQLAAAWEINRATVLQMIRDGRLSAVRVGRSYRIPVESVEAFLANRKTAPVEVHPAVAGLTPQTAARLMRGVAS